MEHEEDDTKLFSKLKEEVQTRNVRDVLYFRSSQAFLVNVLLQVGLTNRDDDGDDDDDDVEEEAALYLLI